MEGKCCKCEEFKWPDPQPPVWTDPADEKKSYCVFHAPADEKKDSKGNPLTGDAFNKKFFALVDKRHAESNKMSCQLLGIVFPGDIEFATQYSRSKQLAPISLQHSIFSGKANFFGLTVTGLALAEATFCGEADFRSVIFEDDPVLDHVTFRKRVYFTEAEFKLGCCFNGAIFDDVAWFDMCIFKGGMSFHSIKANTNALRMHKLDVQTLSHIHFPSIEVNHFSFKECPDWPANFGFENEQLTSKLTLEELYRALKQKAVEEHDQPFASHWHFCEKQMYKQQRWYRRWQPFHLAWLYWFFSGYGEKPLRAGIWLLALLLLPFLVHSPAEIWLSSLWAAIPGIANVDALFASIRDSVNATAAMESIPFTKDLNGPDGTNGWLKVVQGLWQSAILLQFTLFALAVRNRFRR